MTRKLDTLTMDKETFPVSKEMNSSSNATKTYLTDSGELIKEGLETSCAQAEHCFTIYVHTI